MQTIQTLIVKGGANIRVDVKDDKLCIVGRQSIKCSIVNNTLIVDRQENSITNGNTNITINGNNIHFSNNFTHLIMSKNSISQQVKKKTMVKSKTRKDEKIKWIFDECPIFTKIYSKNQSFAKILSNKCLTVKDITLTLTEQSNISLNNYKCNSMYLTAKEQSNSTIVNCHCKCGTFVVSDQSSLYCSNTTCEVLDINTFDQSSVTDLHALNKITAISNHQSAIKCSMCYDCKDNGINSYHQSSCTIVKK